MKDPPQKKHDHLFALPGRLQAALGRFRSHMHLHQMVMRHVDLPEKRPEDRKK